MNYSKHAAGFAQDLFIEGDGSTKHFVLLGNAGMFILFLNGVCNKCLCLSLS